MTSLQDRAALLDNAAFATRPVPQLPPDKALSVEDACHLALKADNALSLISIA